MMVWSAIWSWPPKFNFDETPVVTGGPYVYPLGEPEGEHRRG